MAEHVFSTSIATIAPIIVTFCVFDDFGVTGGDQDDAQILMLSKFRTDRLSHCGYLDRLSITSQRAIQFYEQAFDVKLTANEMSGFQFAFFPMERSAAGSGRTLIHSPPIVPSHNGTTVYFHVHDVDITLAQIAKAGGKTLFPRREIGQHGFIAQFEDSEGNRVALHEMANG